MLLKQHSYCCYLCSTVAVACASSDRRYLPRQNFETGLCRQVRMLVKAALAQPALPRHMVHSNIPNILTVMH